MECLGLLVITARWTQHAFGGQLATWGHAAAQWPAVLVCRRSCLTPTLVYAVGPNAQRTASVYLLLLVLSQLFASCVLALHAPGVSVLLARCMPAVACCLAVSQSLRRASHGSPLFGLGRP